MVYHNIENDSGELLLKYIRTIFFKLKNLGSGSDTDSSGSRSSSRSRSNSPENVKAG